MISPYETIQQLFDDKLSELTDLPAVIKENEVGFLAKDTNNSPLTTKYMRTSIAPLATTDLSIGIGGSDKFGGLFLVEIFTPIGNGIHETNYWIDEIIEQYPKSDILTDGTTIVHIEQYTGVNGQLFDTYHKGGVAIQWTSYVQR